MYGTDKLLYLQFWNFYFKSTYLIYLMAKFLSLQYWNSYSKLTYLMTRMQQKHFSTMLFLRRSRKYSLIPPHAGKCLPTTSATNHNISSVISILFCQICDQWNSVIITLYQKYFQHFLVNTNFFYLNRLQASSVLDWRLEVLRKSSNVWTLFWFKLCYTDLGSKSS